MAENGSADNGLITLTSAHDVPTTLERLTAALEAKGVTVSARIDHAAGAQSVGLALRPTTLDIFGNPAAGTPLMQATQSVGIDLPLKALVWQGEDGAVRLTYNDVRWIATRHGIDCASPDATRLDTTSRDGAAEKAVAALAGALAALAAHATGN